MINSGMMLKASLYMVLLPLVNEASPRGYGYKQYLIKVCVVILSVAFKCVGHFHLSLNSQVELSQCPSPALNSV